MVLLTALVITSLLHCAELLVVVLAMAGLLLADLLATAGFLIHFTVLLATTHLLQCTLLLVAVLVIAGLPCCAALLIVKHLDIHSGALKQLANGTALWATAHALGALRTLVRHG